MNYAKTSLIVLLALTTVGGAALAWRQHLELVELRASAMSANERADWQKKIWDLQKSNRELQERLAALGGRNREAGDEDAVAAGEPGGPNDAGRGPGGFRGRQQQQFAAVRDLMNKPEVQAMIASEQKALLNARYAALFRALNLGPEQADKLTTLLAERQDAQRDVFAAARDQGINPRTDPQGFAKLLADAQSPVNDQIKSLLGDTGYSQLGNYEQTMPQRNVVDLLQSRLIASNAQLTPAQADQLVQVLASTAPTGTTAGAAAPTPGGREGDFGGRMGGMVMGGFGGPGGGMGGALAGGMGSLVGPGAAQITPEAVTQASASVGMNSTQTAALQQLQQQQQTAQQLQQMIRTTVQQSEAAAGTSTGSGSTTAPAAGGRRRGGG